VTGVIDFSFRRGLIDVDVIFLGGADSKSHSFTAKYAG